MKMHRDSANLGRFFDFPLDHLRLCFCRFVIVEIERAPSWTSCRTSTVDVARIREAMQALYRCLMDLTDYGVEEVAIWKIWTK